MPDRADAVAAAAAPDRVALIRRAFRLEWASVGWMLIEAVVAVGAGLAAGSLSLAAFGFDSVIELLSALVLIWRLHAELRLGARFPERTERLAGRIGGVLLWVLAGGIVAGSGWSLWTRHGQEFSWPGLAVTLLAMPVMYALARGKLAVAARLGSGALRADAIESLTCGWLALVVVLGLLATRLTGAWWVDAVAALAIVGFVVREGREAWAGEACCGED